MDVVMSPPHKLEQHRKAQTFSQVLIQTLGYLVAESNSWARRDAVGYIFPGLECTGNVTESGAMCFV